MARPSTPKMPVSQTLISEVLQRVSNAKTKAKKVEILQEYKSPALTKILLCNFAKSIAFVFPSGATPYTPSEKPEGVQHQILFTEHRMIDNMITKTMNGVTLYGCSGAPKPRLQQIKKEQIWIQLLEALHADEAAVLDAVKDKELHKRYKITRQNVIDAFPELGLQGE